MFGEIGGAIGSLAGALIQKRSADKQHQYQTHVEQRDRAERKEYAKQSLKWKVQDAREAGIHPLAALGASTHSPSASMVGGGSLPDMSSLRSMGQDIGRALTAKTTNHQRKMMDLNLREATAETEMKELELANARRRLNGQVGPGEPDQVITKPAEVTSHVKGRRNLEAGSVTSTGFARTADGGLTPVPSTDVKERIEDQLIPELVWSAQNYLAPSFGSVKNKPPKKLLPKGYRDWQYNIKTQTWLPTKGKGRTPPERAADYFRKNWKKVKKKFKQWTR